MSDVAAGQWFSLNVASVGSKGTFMDAGAAGEILLKSTQQASPQVGELLQVFVYRDHKDSLVATLDAPKAEVGKVAYLKVVDKSSAGFFLDWGLPKDLLLPYNETPNPPEVGDRVLVIVFRDDQGRVAASMKLNEFIRDEGTGLKAEQEVELVIAATTDLGVKAVVNHQCWGLIYHADVLEPMAVGQQVQGYVRRVREEDQRVDLSLRPVGTKRLDANSEKILALLRANEGHMAIGDKSPPLVIQRVTGMSKRAFKQACGVLYKQGLLKPGDHEIVLSE